MEDRGNTLYCAECNFVFGKEFVKDLGKNFDSYHAGLHRTVIIDTSKQLPDKFRDIANGE